MALRAEQRPDAGVPVRDTEWSVGRSQRSPWWLELLVVAWLLWVYDAVNNHAPLRLHAALAHARSILQLENWLHLNFELSLNHLAAAHAGIALPVADFYDTAHFVVTLGLAFLLWWKFPRIYRPLRNTLVLINVVGFIVFWLYPLAPPRMLPSSGFVDVVAVTHAFGSWRAGMVASQANELAAMPSLHIAWACWSALAGWRMLGPRRWRAVVWLYPALTGLAVMSTANHFFLDVVAGVATIALAYWLAEVLSALAQRPGPQTLLITARGRANVLAGRLRRRAPTTPLPADSD
ncbi:MAG: phosphatase PAP2 family protein [Acidimicrobiales bacterium]